MNKITYISGEIMGTSVFMHEVPCPVNYKSIKRFGHFKCQCGIEYDACITKVKGRGDRCPQCAAKNLATIGGANKTHGHSIGKKTTKVYKLWLGIKDRCYNPNSEFYHLYGGKGVNFYEPWRNDFQTFYDAVGEPPTKKHSFDKYPNNDGNYEPGNWRWATQTQQMRNTSKTVFLVWEGERISLPDLADKFGMNRRLLWERHVRDKMSLQYALTKAVDSSYRLIMNTQTGVFYYSLNEAAKTHGISRTSLQRYLRLPDKNKTSLISV